MTSRGIRRVEETKRLKLAYRQGYAGRENDFMGLAKRFYMCYRTKFSHSIIMKK